MIEEHYIRSLESEEEAKTITSKLNSVVNHMIYKEGIIIVTKDDEADADKVLILNSNYANPEIY